jgi:hypothetical protein
MRVLIILLRQRSYNEPVTMSVQPGFILLKTTNQLVIEF